MNTTKEQPKTVKVELEFSLDQIRALLANQYPAISTMSDHTISEAIQSGFISRYWDTDLDEWVLHHDPAFKKLMDAVWDYAQQY